LVSDNNCFWDVLVEINVDGDAHVGVYSLCTLQLAKEIPSAFFRVVGTAFAVTVLLLWIVVAAGTLWKAWTGEMIAAPCLKDFEEDDMKLHLLRRNGAKRS
jgi:hypothetical protein